MGVLISNFSEFSLDLFESFLFHFLERSVLLFHSFGNLLTLIPPKSVDPGPSIPGGKCSQQKHFKILLDLGELIILI